MNDVTNHSNYSFHHGIPKYEVTRLINFSKKMSLEEIDAKIKDIEKYLNQTHIKNLILQNMDKNRWENSNHGKLIHAAFAFNPRNMWHGPKPELRLDDPKQKHEAKFIKKETPEYQIAYKNYLENKCIDNFRRLPQNSVITATKSLIETGTRAFYYKINI